ncbi:MAG: alpha/beta hydrolase [Dehalococcoidia bacterium]
MPHTTIEGHRLHYEESGEGPPIILHHGLAQWGDDWHRAGWVTALAQRSRVVIIDALGHGRSDRPHQIEPYRIENRANAVLTVADLLGIGQFDFFGFSMGGRVAFQLAASTPERIRGLIIGGMHGRAPSLDRESLQKRAATLRNGRLRVLERAVGATSERPPNDPEALALSTEAILEWPGAELRLHAIKSPVLMFGGEEDPLFPDAWATASRLPGAEFERLPGRGHAASFNHSELTLPAVLRFLGQLDRGRT